MCSDASCKALMAEVASSKECILADGRTNKDYSCDTDSQGKSNLALFIGIGCGIALLLCITIACFVIRHRKNKTRPNLNRNSYPVGNNYVAYFRDNSTKYVVSEAENGFTQPTPSDTGSSNGLELLSMHKMTQIDLEDLIFSKIDPSAIQDVKLLGRGAFGEVWLSTYMFKNVAVKKLLNHKKTANDLKKFVIEIQLVAK